MPNKNCAQHKVSKESISSLRAKQQELQDLCIQAPLPNLLKFILPQPKAAREKLLDLAKAPETKIAQEPSILQEVCNKRRNPHKSFPAENILQKAEQEYAEGLYWEAIESFLKSLDTEPYNWHARLFLGASYYRLGNFAAAERIFRLCFDNSPLQTIKSKACSGLQSARAHLDQMNSRTHPEFGHHVQEWKVAPPPWLAPNA